MTDTPGCDVNVSGHPCALPAGHDPFTPEHQRIHQRPANPHTPTPETRTTHKTTDHPYPTLISPQTATRLAQVTRQTLLNWVDHGYLTRYRTPGGEHRYDRQEILDWVAAIDTQTQPPPVDPMAPPPDVAAVLDTPPAHGTCPTCGQDWPT